MEKIERVKIRNLRRSYGRVEPIGRNIEVPSSLHDTLGTLGRSREREKMKDCQDDKKKKESPQKTFSDLFHFITSVFQNYGLGLNPPASHSPQLAAESFKSR